MTRTTTAERPWRNARIREFMRRAWKGKRNSLGRTNRSNPCLLSILGYSRGTFGPELWRDLSCGGSKFECQARLGLAGGEKQILLPSGRPRTRGEPFSWSQPLSQHQHRRFNAASSAALTATEPKCPRALQSSQRIINIIVIYRLLANSTISPYKFGPVT